MNRTLQQVRGRFAPLGLEDLRQEMNRLVEGLFDTDESQPVAFVPRANFAETDAQYEITVELPGMRSEDVNVEFKDGHLWITGDHKSDLTEKGKTYHRVERRYGAFRRVISLGKEVNSQAIEATYRDGLLKVVVPKAAAVQPKKIEIRG
jgi:HSP20 family protein